MSHVVKSPCPRMSYVLDCDCRHCQGICLCEPRDELLKADFDSERIRAFRAEDARDKAEARVAVLEAALEEIANYPVNKDWKLSFTFADRARAALNGGGE